MIKINIQLLKLISAFAPIVIIGSFLLIPASVAVIVLSAHSSFVLSATSSKQQPTPDAPVAIVPSLRKTPTQAIPALQSTTTPSIVITPQPVVTTVPSSSVSSLKPTSASSPPSSTGQMTTVTTGYSSTNWSGYMATTGSFSAVSGSWVVPQATGSGSSMSGDAAWIGIGGVTTSDLIQVGTATTISSAGKATTSFFYEMLPAAANIVTGITIRAGDAVHASLTGSGNQWTILITDVTTGQSFTQPVTYASSLSSAEWIEEDPSYANGQLMPLDNFGTISFSAATTTIGGVSTSLAGAKSQPITLVDGSGHVLAAPSQITSDGKGFSVSHS